jgi:hypothetical protein
LALEASRLSPDLELLFSRSLSSRYVSAKQAGEQPGNFDATAGAQVLVTFLQGLFRVIRVLQNRSEVERQLEMLLSGLGL